MMTSNKNIVTVMTESRCCHYDSRGHYSPDDIEGKYEDRGGSYRTQDQTYRIKISTLPANSRLTIALYQISGLEEDCKCRIIWKSKEKERYEHDISGKRQRKLKGDIYMS